MKKVSMKLCPTKPPRARDSHERQRILDTMLRGLVAVVVGFLVTVLAAGAIWATLVNSDKCGEYISCVMPIIGFFVYALVRFVANIRSSEEEGS
jgi:hypothetical protein